MPTPTAIRELRRVDLLVIGGGGLINDLWFLPIPRYLSWVLAARVVGTRVAWVGVGVGPIRRGAWRWLASLAARLSDTVLVRDAASARLLGGSASGVEVIPDPALFLEPPDPATPGPFLGLIVREPVHGREPESGRLIEVIAAFATAGRSAGLQPRLLMMAPATDRAFTERVADHIARDGDRPPIVVLGPSAADVWQQFGELQVSVSVRLHGVLLSAMAGVPCVPIAYDDKVTSAAQRLGLADLVVDPRDAPGEDAARLLAAVQEPAQRRVVHDKVALLRAQTDAVRAMLR